MTDIKQGADPFVPCFIKRIHKLFIANVIMVIN